MHHALQHVRPEETVRTIFYIYYFHHTNLKYMLCTDHFMKGVVIIYGYATCVSQRVITLNKKH